jgi:Tfp pilus assembly protein PilN
MATILVPPEPAATAERAPRMLTIAANLLPPEIVESRRGRKVRRIVVSALAAFIALLAGWYSLASYQTSLARDDLSSAQSDVERLARLQKPFAELISAQNESRSIDVQLSALLAGDLQWSRLLSSLRAAAPQGVQITSVTSALAAGADGAGGSSGSAGSRLPSTSTEKLVGTITITGTATSKVAVAAYVDALAKAPGLANPLLDSANQRGPLFDFTVRLDITGSALSGHYLTKSGKDTGGK